jgi:hypothetical protein
MKHTEEQIAQVEAWLVDMVRRGWVKSAGKDLWKVTPLGTRVLPPIMGLIYGATPRRRCRRVRGGIAPDRSGPQQRRNKAKKPH